MNERVNIQLDRWILGGWLNGWMEGWVHPSRNGHIKSMESSEQTPSNFSCCFTKDGSEIGNILWWEATKSHGLNIFLIMRSNFPDNAYTLKHSSTPHQTLTPFPFYLAKLFSKAHIKIWHNVHLFFIFKLPIVPLEFAPWKEGIFFLLCSWMYKWIHGCIVHRTMFDT